MKGKQTSLFKITAWLVLFATIVALFPVVQTPEPASAKVTDFKIVNILAVRDGYDIGFNQNGDLIITGYYYKNSSATISYRTTYIYFHTEYTEGKPTSGVNGNRHFAVDVRKHDTRDSVIMPGYVEDTYYVDHATLRNMAETLYGIDALDEPRTVYMSEGFNLKKKKDASIPWNESHVVPGKPYNTLTGIRGAGQGKWEWSQTSYNNFVNYFDFELTIDFKDLFDPPGGRKKYKLTVSEEGNGLVSGSSGEFFPGTSVYEIAQPDNGYRLKEWKGDTDGITGVDWNSEQISFEMPRRDVHLIAVFEKVDGPVPPPTRGPVEDVPPVPENDPDITKPPTPTPEPTPKITYQPTEDTIIYENNYNYYTTDKGYTWQGIKDENGGLPNQDKTNYWTISTRTPTDSEYSVGTDAKGNKWFFVKDSGLTATYVHPSIYNGYNIDTEEVRFITELTFPSKITCDGTTYTVVSIGGGTSRYHTDKVVKNTNTASKYEYEAYGPLVGEHIYDVTLAENASYSSYEGCSSESWVGVAGNGGISGYGYQSRAWTSTGAKQTNDYAQVYQVYNTTLKQVTIPNTVRTVMYRAFYGCQALTKISGGENLQNIHKEAFPAVSNEARVSEVVSKNQYNIYKYNNSYDLEYFTQTMLDYEKTMTLPEYMQLAVFPVLKSIGESAFLRRENLHDVVLSSGVIEICKRAFYECKLNSIKIPGATTTIYADKETLGTAGLLDKRTTIITEPESTAMYYGIDYLYYYRLRCGYKITYKNNFEPAETYMTTAEFREVLEEASYIHDWGTHTNRNNQELPTANGSFFMITEDGKAYVVSRKKDTYASGTEVAFLADYKIKEVLDRSSVLVRTQSTPGGSISYYDNYYILKTTTGEMIYCKPKNNADEDCFIINLPKDAYKIQSSTQTVSIFSGAERTGAWSSANEGTYYYYLRSDGKIYRTKYKSADGKFLRPEAQVTECVSNGTDKRFESFVISPFVKLGEKTYNSKDSTKTYTITLPKIFAKADDGTFVCATYIKEQAAFGDKKYFRDFLDREYSLGPDTSLYQWIPCEPFKDIAVTFYNNDYHYDNAVYGSEEPIGYLLTEEGTILAIDFNYFVSKTTDSGDNVYYVEYPMEEAGVVFDEFDLVRGTDMPFIKATNGNTYHIPADKIDIGKKSTTISLINYLGFKVKVNTRKITAQAPTYNSSSYRLSATGDVDLIEQLYGTGTLWHDNGGDGWDVYLIYDDKGNIYHHNASFRDFAKALELPENTRTYELLQCGSGYINAPRVLAVTEDGEFYLSGHFTDAIARNSLVNVLEGYGEEEYARALAHIPTVLLGWQYLETIYDNMFPRDGYTFLNWNEAADDSGKKYYPGDEVYVKSALSLYGQWEKTVNKVKYHPNGGSGLMADSTCDPLVTKKITLSECLYTKDGHGFIGWNTKKDGTGTMYRPGAVITTKQQTTYVYAQWEPLDYTLHVAEEEVRIRPVTSDSYELSYNEEFTVPNAMADRQYSVDYNLNKKSTMSTTPKWKTPTPLASNYTTAKLSFVGWELWEEIVKNKEYNYLNRVYLPGQTDKNFARHKEYAPILFPYWGGAASYIDLPVAECNGYLFVGWTETANETDEEKVIHAEDGSGAMYQPKGNETLYAFYQPNDYEIALVADVEGADPGDITVTQTEVVMTFDKTIPKVAVPESNVYIFMGYYDKLDADGVPTADAVQYYDETGTPCVDPATGKTMTWTVHDESVTALYAYYISEVKVTLDGRGATKQEQTSVTMTYEKVGPAVIPPEKTGYTFQGYYTGTRGTGKKYFDANGKGCAVWLEKKTNILYAYWVQNPVELPEQNPTENPDMLPEERVVIEASLDYSRVHIYADDNDPTTGAMTDVQPYLVSDVVIDGKLEVAGAIPSTENVAIRAKMGAWMLSSVLERRTGVDYVRVYVTVPYRTQYEDAETEELMISDIQYATYDFMVPKAWSYWVVADGGIYFPEKVVVENEALAGGTVEIPVVWDSEDAVTKPSYRIVSYGDKEHHVCWNARGRENAGIDADGVAKLTLSLSDVEYIVSKTPGVIPNITEHLYTVCYNAAWRDGTEFTVNSDHMEVAGVTLLSDVMRDIGDGAEPDLFEIGRIVQKIEETGYGQTYESGIFLGAMAENNRYETKAEVIYQATGSNVGVDREKRVFVTDVNEINIHTPVICIPEIYAEHEEMYQCETVPENHTVLVLSEEGIHSDFVLKVSNIGCHSDKKGYGERSYTEYLAVKDGKEWNEVCFPFSVWSDVGNDKENENDVCIDAGEWYVLGCETQRFYLPVDTKEGSYEIRFRSVAINGVGQEEKIEDRSNTQPAHYAAVGIVPVYVTGRLYDFAVYEVGGTSAWEEAEVSYYTVGPQAEDSDLMETLPLRIGVHPNYQNIGGLPMGGYIKFCLKCVGSSFGEDALLTVTPHLFSVAEGVYETVDVYYEEETEQGVFLRKWDEEEHSFLIEKYREVNPAVFEWDASFSLPERLYVADYGTDVQNYQARFGLTFSEDFWQKDAILMLRFACSITNSQGETLYYGMLPANIANNIWQKEATGSYREDKKGNRFEILGGEVAVIYPGDYADGAYTTDGIY